MVFQQHKGLVLRLVVLGFGLLYAAEVPAQACCSGGVPLGGSLGLGSADQKSIQFLVTYDQNILNDLIDQRELLADDTRSRRTRAALLEINYGISPRWSVAAVVPYIRQERFILHEFTGNTEFTMAQGIGDIMLLVKYNLVQSSTESNWTWIIGAGPKMPTGRSDFRNNTGFTMAADMQPGSGSWDAMFWSFLQKDKLFHPNMSWLMISTYRHSGSNNSYNNSQTYRFGNESQITSGINYNLLLKWPIDVFLFGRYRQQTPDLIDNSEFPGSGGIWLSALPGFNISFRPDLALRASLELPAYRSLEGAQLTTTYRATLSFFYNLDFGKKSKNLNNRSYEIL